MKEITNALNQAKNLDEKKEALKAYLSFLCETDECRNILKELIDSLKEAWVENEDLIVLIPWVYTENDEKKDYAKIIFNKPFTGSFDESVPESFRRVFKQHNGIGYAFVTDMNKKVDWYSWQFFGVSENGKMKGEGYWESEAIEEGGNENVMEFLESQGKSASDVICVGVFDEGQNWYLLHPMKKNKLSEPAIVSFDHGDCDLSSNEPFEHGLGGVVVRELMHWVRK